MAASWASWSLVLSGGALVVAAAVFPFLPPTSRAFLIEDAFEVPGLALAALGALAGRQRLWPLGLIGALVVLAVDLAWRWVEGAAAFHVAWMAGAVLVAGWACWPMRGAGLALAVAQIAFAVATLAWLVHGTMLAVGDALATTLVAVVAVLATMGVAIGLRGLALRQSPTLL